MGNKCVLIMLMMSIVTHGAWAKPVTVDMKVEEPFVYKLANGKEKKITVVSYEETRDKLRNAVRRAVVTVDVDGVRGNISVALYNMPRVINGVKLDAAVTKGYMGNQRMWARWDFDLNADVRMRFWNPNQPLLEPGTFCCPLKQRLNACTTIFSNEISGDRDVSIKSIYYHYALDFGGYDKMEYVYAMTDGEVVSAPGKRLPDIPEEISCIIRPHYKDEVCIRDSRGWYYRYSHLYAVLPHIKVGSRVKMGEWIGILGKEGSSGGWSHLHLGVLGSEGDERGIINAYPFIVEAYLQEHPGALLAIARPHQLIQKGDTARLDGSNSICDGGKIVSYEWQFHDGTTAKGPVVHKQYPESGVYSEILRVTDNRGQVDVDFTEIKVPDAAGKCGNINLAYYPTEGIGLSDGKFSKPGRGEVYFKVRSFKIQGGKEIWDFGDGTSAITCSENDYATLSHHYDKPGLYIVTVRRTSTNGIMAMTNVKVVVEDKITDD